MFQLEFYQLGSLSAVGSLGNPVFSYIAEDSLIKAVVNLANRTTVITDEIQYCSSPDQLRFKVIKADSRDQ